jgi:hypothetical protein
MKHLRLNLEFWTYTLAAGVFTYILTGSWYLAAGVAWVVGLCVIFILADDVDPEE